MKRACLGLALAVLVAGCGGSSEPSTFTAQKTRLCLKKDPSVKLNRKLDFVASTATGGALHAVLRKNDVTIVFGETEGDANNINQAYHRFVARNVGIEDILRQDKNAVLLFKEHPSDTDLSTIEDCLS